MYRQTWFSYAFFVLASFSAFTDANGVRVQKRRERRPHRVHRLTSCLCESCGFCDFLFMNSEELRLNDHKMDLVHSWSILHVRQTALDCCWAVVLLGSLLLPLLCVLSSCMCCLSRNRTTHHTRYFFGLLMIYLGFVVLHFLFRMLLVAT